ncbi:MAG: energy transducer TonB [Hyphomonadaceae bacterium]|nr:energy transducer TonB [Hyphomonadaceae bacterium]
MAQETDAIQAALSLAPAAAPSPPFPDLRPVDMTRQCDAFGSQRFYPQRALQRGIDGRVVLDCAIGADGKAQTCYVLAEIPSAWSSDARPWRSVATCGFVTSPRMFLPRALVAAMFDTTVAMAMVNPYVRGLR